MIIVILNDRFYSDFETILHFHIHHLKIERHAPLKTKPLQITMVNE